MAKHGIIGEYDKHPGTRYVETGSSFLNVVCVYAYAIREHVVYIHMWA